MKRVTTAEARERFSEVVNEVAWGGQQIVLTRRGRDVARLVPLDDSRRESWDRWVGAETTSAYAGAGAGSSGAAPSSTNGYSQLTMPGSRSSLASLFASRTLVSLLRVFLLHRGGRFHQRELSRMTGSGLRSVQVELERLEATGLVASETSGRLRQYWLNEGHPAAEDLRRLFGRSFAVPEVLRAVLNGMAGMEAAALYGSLARGAETAESDVDLLIVGRVDGVSLAEALESAESQIGRVVNAAVFPVDELRRKYDERNHFVRAVLDAPLVWIVGDRVGVGLPDDT